MTLSRQRKWQLKKRAEGLCARCGKNPITDNELCKECFLVARKERQANYRKQTGGSSWVEGGRGRPPKYRPVSLDKTVNAITDNATLCNGPG